MKPDDTFKLERLDRSEFSKVYKLLEENFPYGERNDYNEQLALLDKPIYRIDILKSKSGELIAFVAYNVFEDILFIEHFVVIEAYRNRGVGSWILSELGRVYGLLICLEVEIPDNIETDNKVKFYTLNNFKLCHYKYWQPPIIENQDNLPLLLFTSKSINSSNEFKNIQSKIYKYVYELE